MNIFLFVALLCSIGLNLFFLFYSIPKLWKHKTIAEQYLRKKVTEFDKTSAVVFHQQQELNRKIIEYEKMISDLKIKK